MMEKINSFWQNFHLCLDMKLWYWSWKWCFWIDPKNDGLGLVLEIMLWDYTAKSLNPRKHFLDSGTDPRTPFFNWQDLIPEWRKDWLFKLNNTPIERFNFTFLLENHVTHSVQFIVLGNKWIICSLSCTTAASDQSEE